MSDRADITELVVSYTRAVDRRDWDAYEQLFTADAVIDYSAFGGVTGGVEAAKAFLAESMPVFTKTQHMVGLPEIDLHGDRATAVTPCHNPMLMGHGPDAKVMVCSLWYHHELVRTAEGWRIARLGEERNFMTILPGPDIPPP